MQIYSLPGHQIFIFWPVENCTTWNLWYLMLRDAGWALRHWRSGLMKFSTVVSQGGKIKLLSTFKIPCIVIPFLTTCYYDDHGLKMISDSETLLQANSFGCRNSHTEASILGGRGGGQFCPPPQIISTTSKINNIYNARICLKSTARPWKNIKFNIKILLNMHARKVLYCEERADFFFFFFFLLLPPLPQSEKRIDAPVVNMRTWCCPAPPKVWYFWKSFCI